MFVLAIPSAAGQIGAIAAGGLIGWGLLRGGPQAMPQHPLAVQLPRGWSAAALVSFFGLPLLAASIPSQVFRGGHVVLPLLQSSVVGLLLVALYLPVWTSAIFGPADFAIGVLVFLLLVFWTIPPWLVVIFGAAAATAVSSVPAFNG